MKQLMAVSILLAMAACGGSSDSGSTDLTAVDAATVPSVTPLPAIPQIAACLLLVQSVDLTQALEESAKDGKPVLMLVHRKDWSGLEKFQKAMKEMLGESLDKVHLTHVDVQEREELIKKFEIKKLDGGLLLLDGRVAASQVFSRLEAGEPTAEAVKKFVAEGVKEGGNREACRAAVSAMWASFKKGKIDDFKASLWPVQLATMDAKAVQGAFAEGLKAAEKWESLTFMGITEGNPAAAKKTDETVEVIYIAKFDMVNKEKKNGTSFDVVRTKKGTYVVWGE